MNLSPATTSFSRIRLFVGLSLASFVLMPATGRAASEIQTWESDDYGQVSERPMCPLFVDVEMGWFHGLALDNQGGLHSWGLDSSSQVSNTPTGTGFTRIAAGNHHSLALDAAGSIHAWGYDHSGQVSGAPVGPGFTAIGAGNNNSFAIDSTGAIHCWGSDPFGECANKPVGPFFTQIDGGSNAGIALDPVGKIYTWGYDVNQQITNTPGGQGYTAISAGGGHGFAVLDANGAIHTWGANSIANPPPGNGFIDIAVGNAMALALDASGAVHAWGWDGDQVVSAAPTGSGYTTVAVRRYSAAVLKTVQVGCTPSFGCNERLVLFPSTTSSVPDNQPGVDLDSACGTLTVSNVPFPDDPQATFSGTIFLDAPNAQTPAQVVVTNASIVNPAADPDAGVADSPLHTCEPLACAEFEWTSGNIAGAPYGSGMLVASVQGTLHNDGLGVTEGGEEVNVTAVGTTFVVANQPTSPPAYVTASWSSSAPTSSPQTVSAFNAQPGYFQLGTGIIGVLVELDLPSGEYIQLPTSIEVTVTEESSTPALSSQGMGLLALLVAAAGGGAVCIRVRRRR